MRLAAIDIGTISARLLVADVESGRVREVLRRGEVVHLGEALAATGSIGGDAIERAVDALRSFVGDTQRLGAERIVAVATSASRDASDREEFLSRVSQVGVFPEIVSGTREAELSFLGATAKRPGRDTLVVDIGGGSTEFSFGSDSAELALSIDIGARRVTDGYLASDPPTQTEVAAAERAIDALLAPALESLPARPARIVALAGTVTSLAAMALELDPYDSKKVDGYELTLEEVRRLRESLAAIPVEARRAVVGLELSRASVIVGGALIVERLLELSGRLSCTVSEADILWGILIDAERRGGVAERHTQET